MILAIDIFIYLSVTFYFYFTFCFFQLKPKATSGIIIYM